MLKGVEFKFRYEQKREKQEKYKKINEEIARKKTELMNLINKKETIKVDMLDERQLTIYINPYSKNLGS